MTGVPRRRAATTGRTGSFATVALVAVLAVACGATAGDDGSAGGGSGATGDATTTNDAPDRAPDDAVAGQVLVSAAASLTDAFADVEAAFEQLHPDADVVRNLGGSSSLREQLLDGAPADVFASADVDTMDDVVDAGATAGDPVAFATNHLQIAVPAGNPAGITGLEDFADDDLLLGLCAAGVPCGDLAREALAAAGITPRIDTDEPDVRALLAKVEADELDAGITYATDVAAADGRVAGIDLPPDVDVRATYPIAVVADAPNPVAAQAFVDFVLADDGRRLLTQRGFGVP